MPGIVGPGNPTPSAAAAPTNQSVSFYANLIKKKYGQKAATAYTDLANGTPQDTPYDVFVVFVENIVGKGLAKAIADAEVAVGKATAQAAGGAAAAATAISNPLAAIGDFFQRLGQANTWIRVGEVVLGLILIAVGVARITHAVPVATKIAGVAAKGALL